MMAVLKSIFHLILGSAALAVSWMGTTFLAVAVLVGPFVFRLFVGYRTNKWRGVAQALRSASKYQCTVWAILFLIGMGRFIYRDHTSLAMANAALTKENKELRSKLEWRRHNISTSDPVFPNIIYMLQAFNSFKRDMNGEPCVLYASAPKETVALASEMMQLGGPLSGCSPLGPIGADDLDLDPEVVQGTVPDAIVVHAVEGEKAADNLFSTLGNQIQLKRSYRLLKHPEKRWAPQRANQHVVWLQFGKNAKWNSERF